MSKWICEDCQNVYDSRMGDDESGIDPQTPFEMLPEDWQCPECGAPKLHYRKMDDDLTSMDEAII